MKSFAHLLMKFGSRSKSLPASLFVAAALIFSFALATSASADVLELKTGEIVQGKFVSASSATIRFEVNGQAQTFAIKDVLNIGFTDTSDAATAPTPPPPPPTPVATPQPDPNAAALPQPNNDASQQQQQAQPAPAGSDQQAGNAPPAAAPPPPQTAPYNGPTQAVTIPSGTTVVIRMIDSVDSQTNHVSDPFHASLDAPLVVGNTVVAQKGADVYGMLANAKDSGHISGAPQLTLELTGIRINGNVVPVDSTTYDVVGKSRGSQSAERIGGGAIAGAVLGGIIGGPKGAAVGATLGAGGGTAVQLSTHGDRIRVPSETRLEFTTENDVTALVPAASN
jgi:outer membrane biosynthesis protein TonB